MKILFTDLDGTLLNNQSMVSRNTKAFLDDFMRAGHKLVLSSGLHVHVCSHAHTSQCHPPHIHFKK